MNKNLIIRTVIYLFMASIVAAIFITRKTLVAEKEKARIEANEAAEAEAAAKLLQTLNSESGRKH